MNVKLIVAGLILVSLSCSTVAQDHHPVGGQFDQPPMDATLMTGAEFKRQLLELLIVVEASSGKHTDAVEKLHAMTDDQAELWMQQFTDLPAFMASVNSMKDQLTQGPSRRSPSKHAPVSVTEAQAAPGPRLQSPTDLTELSELELPPTGGAYEDVILDGIREYGLGSGEVDEGCDGDAVGNTLGVLLPLRETVNALDVLCVLGGCDPLGFLCLASCGVWEIADTALSAVEIGVTYCDVHEGWLNAAQDAATWENVEGLVSDVSHLNDDLTEIERMLDEEIEMRKVHMQILQLELRKRYLLIAREDGESVSVTIDTVEVFDEDINEFIPLLTSGIAVVTEIEPGVYDLELNLEPKMPDKLYRVKVTHEHEYEHVHKGEIYFHKNASGESS